MKSQGYLDIRLITHNIRYATAHPFQGEKPWAIRFPRLTSELCFHAAHNQESLICLQEVLHHQLNDILHSLNYGSDEWRYIGVGRDDGREAGEYSPLFYRPGVWKLLEHKNIWLSETPDRPSKSWDAASIRILTIGKLQHRQSRRQVIAMNTHLDDQGSRSRLEAAKIIAQEIQIMSSQKNGTKLPVVLAGDLNSEKNMEAYQHLTEYHFMTDVYEMVNPDHRYGHRDTFTGFGHEDSPPTRIDFILVNRGVSGAEHATAPDKQWIAKNHGILENRFDDGIYISDHRAVVADLLLSL